MRASEAKPVGSSSRRAQGGAGGTTDLDRGRGTVLDLGGAVALTGSHRTGERSWQLKREETGKDERLKSERDPA